MFNIFYEILPLFVVRFLAKRFGERVKIGTHYVALARHDVLIRIQ